MHLLSGPESLKEVLELFNHWLFTYLININALIQLVVTLTAFALAYFLSKPLRHFLKDHRIFKPHHEKIKESLSALIVIICWVVIEIFIVGISAEFRWPNHLNQTTLSLLLVWIFAGFVASFVKDKLISKLLAVGAWTIAALYITGLLEPTTAVLSQLGLRVGELRISILDFLWGAVLLSCLLWAANTLSYRVEVRINQRDDLEPTIKVLFGKLLRFFLVGSAFLITISAIGVDLSALTVFGGAFVLGIGFGLQKVISNLICGMILLMDRSLKPGDVISVRDGKVFGIVNQLSARFICIRALSGEEHLIPNEEIITQGVENWTYSDRNVCLVLTLRVSLDTDLRRAMGILIESCNGVDRVLAYPAPAVRLKGFGEWAAELDLYVWVGDPENGMGAVRSDLYLNIWDAFKREKITIPLPQQEVHVAGRAGPVT